MRFGWLSSQDSKKFQRRMNKVVRLVNSSLEQDELWQGRFVLRQRSASFYRYSDKSGGVMYVLIDIIDKKTHKYTQAFGSVNELCFPNGSHLWRAVNKFIVEQLNVWSTEHPYQEKQDWRNIAIPQLEDMNYIRVYY